MNRRRRRCGAPASITKKIFFPLFKKNTPAAAQLLFSDHVTLHIESIYVLDAGFLFYLCSAPVQRRRVMNGITSRAQHKRDYTAHTYICIMYICIWEIFRVKQIHKPTIIAGILVPCAVGTPKSWDERAFKISKNLPVCELENYSCIVMVRCAARVQANTHRNSRLEVSEFSETGICGVI